MLDDAELKALTYSQHPLREFTLDDNLPTFERPHQRISTLYESPRFGLAGLGKIPLELLQAILFKLDLWTLNEFRRVNRQAMLLVESMPQYITIITHADHAMRSIFSIGAGFWTTLEVLYNKLCTAECEGCGDFGGYLYILTCKRVCFICFTEDKRYLPLRFRHAIQKYGITRPILNTLPCMKSVPGTYTQNRKKLHERVPLVDGESALNAGLELHGDARAMEMYVSAATHAKMLEYEKKASKVRESGTASTARRPRQPLIRDPFDHFEVNPLRFMAIIRMPVFTRSSKCVEWGFHCVGCQKLSRSRPQHFRRKYTVASFSEHLRQCGNIRQGQHHAN